jgi:small subunit ribosomal protein S8
MSMTDPIADYLTRLRNAARARHPKVDIPASRLKKESPRILLQEHYIRDYSILEYQGKQFLRILLKYQKNGESVISGIKRISRPGLRKYVHKVHIPRVLDGLGVSIITTSQGVMTGKKAKSLGLGGEVLCNIW